MLKELEEKKSPLIKNEKKIFFFKYCGGPES